MTVDWFVWLTPLIFLPVVALFVFVGCDAVLVGPGPSLIVKAESLTSTAWFRVKWTFFGPDPFPQVGFIERPAPPNTQPVPAGNPYQPDVQVEADPNTDPEFMGILQKNPVLVQCECTVQDSTKINPDYPTAADPVPYTSWSAEKVEPIIWRLSRDADNYTLTPYKSVSGTVEGA